MPPEGAPVLTGTYDVPGAFPVLPDTTPTAGDPYGIGLAISLSSFNQLLGGMAECGAMSLEITELALFGPDPVPITAGLLTFMVPEFANLDPAREVIGNERVNDRYADAEFDQVRFAVQSRD